MQKTIESRKTAFVEAENLFKKQKEAMKEEMRVERDRIIQEIVNKVIEEHLVIITKLRKDITDKDTLNLKLQTQLKELTSEITKVKSKAPELVKLKSDVSVMTDPIICEEHTNANLSIVTTNQQEPNKDHTNNIEEEPKCKVKEPERKQEITNEIETFEIADIYEVRNTQEERQNSGGEEKKYKILYTKMQTIVNMSKATIDILRGKLKSTNIKYQNLYNVILNSNNL